MSGPNAPPPSEVQVPTVVALGEWNNFQVMVRGTVIARGPDAITGFSEGEFFVASQHVDTTTTAFFGPPDSQMSIFTHVEAIALHSPLYVVQRTFTEVKEGSSPTSPYFSPLAFGSAEEANAYLAMGATEGDPMPTHVALYEIAAGSTILTGFVASQADNPDFSPESIGSGIQVLYPAADTHPPTRIG